MASSTLTYNLVEMFFSIQGEGYFSGKPAIFIRFSGCNLECPFCDEPLHRLPGEDYSKEDILNFIRKYAPCEFVVLTGGEPTIHPHFNELVDYLQEYGFFVSVETNGIKRITSSPNWITVSPKTEEFFYGDELKLIYMNQELSQYEKFPFKHFYLQPMNYKKEIDFDAVEHCLEALKAHPKWSLSLQLQKVIYID